MQVLTGDRLRLYSGRRSKPTRLQYVISGRRRKRPHRQNVTQTFEDRAGDNGASGGRCGKSKVCGRRVEGSYRRRRSVMEDREIKMGKVKVRCSLL